MAAIKSFHVSRDGKELRIQMQAGGMTVARLSRAFQASKECNVDVLYVSGIPKNVSLTWNDFLSGGIKFSLPQRRIWRHGLLAE